MWGNAATWRHCRQQQGAQAFSPVCRACTLIPPSTHLQVLLTDAVPLVVPAVQQYQHRTGSYHMRHSVQACWVHALLAAQQRCPPHELTPSGASRRHRSPPCAGARAHMGSRHNGIRLAQEHRAAGSIAAGPACSAGGSGLHIGAATHTLHVPALRLHARKAREARGVQGHSRHFMQHTPSSPLRATATQLHRAQAAPQPAHLLP